MSCARAFKQGCHCLTDGRNGSRSKVSIPSTGVLVSRWKASVLARNGTVRKALRRSAIPRTIRRDARRVEHARCHWGPD
jgi:hypothetical protein